MRSFNVDSYMFVLSDGLYQYDQKELIKSNVLSCLQCNISIFGIGIGIYPIGINDLFPQVVFSSNPNNLIRAIASCFRYEPGITIEKSIQVILPQKNINQNYIDIFNELIKAEEKPIFKDLVNHLHKVPVGLDIVSLVYNEEQKPMYSSPVLTNDDKMKEMYVKDLFKGQKILIVMPYDCSLNIDENPKVDKKYLESSFDENNDCCVKKAVGFYGIDIKIVQNYDAAIDELTNQTNPVE